MKEYILYQKLKAYMNVLNDWDTLVRNFVFVSVFIFSCVSNLSEMINFIYYSFSFTVLNNKCMWFFDTDLYIRTVRTCIYDIIFECIHSYSLFEYSIHSTMCVQCIEYSDTTVQCVSNQLL